MIKKLIFLQVFLIIIISVYPQSNIIPTFNYNDTAVFDAYIHAAIKHPGVAGCAVKNNQVIFNRSYGYANIEQSIPVADSTLFCLASVTKAITATALMQLYENGSFELDDDINDYLPEDLVITNPDFPDEKITFRHLLTHTSGINNDFNFVTWLVVKDIDSPIPLDSFLYNFFIPGGEYYSRPFYEWSPGSNYQYSSVGFALIGYLVEVISSLSFEEYCQQNIFNPLEMEESSFFLANLNTNNLAIQYHDFTRYGFMSSPRYPSGLLKTSAFQLANFAIAYLNDGKFKDARILDSATVSLIHTIQYPEIASDRGLVWYEYGYPSLVTNFYNAPCESDYFEHAGSNSNGIATRMGCFQNSDENLGVLVLTNGNDLDYLYIWEQMWRYAILHDKAYPCNVSVNGSFFNSENDTVIIKTQMVNPHDHELTVHVIYTSLDSTTVDSVRLYDDGLHFDELNNDGIWGNRITDLYNADDFIVSISTLDEDTGSYLVLYDLACFMSKGPVMFETYESQYEERLPAPGKKYDFYLILRNPGSSDITDIVVDLTSLDTLAAFVNSSSTFLNISANDYSRSNRPFSIKISEFAENETLIPIEIDLYKITNDTNNYFIYENKYHLWTDTFYIEVTEPQFIISKNIESIVSIYPNPVNDRLNIELNTAKWGTAIVELFDMTGRNLYEREFRNIYPGNNIQIDVSGHPPGVLIVKVMIGDNIIVRKVVIK